MNFRSSPFIVYPDMTQKAIVLSTEKECILIRQAQSGNVEALTQLLEANMLLICSIVHKYSTRCSYDGEDLVQEGILGCMKGIKRYEIERGVCLSTYIVWWINAFIRRAWQKQHKKDSHEVEKILDYQRPSAQISHNDVEKKISRQWMLQRIVQTLNTLTEPHGKMVKMYYGIGGFRQHSLREISQEYSITHEGVRQNLRKALNKLGKRQSIKDLQYTY